MPSYDSHSDIISLILEDHRPLKSLLRVMKNPAREISERREAFNNFAPLLLSHTHAEEQTLYKHLMTQSRGLLLKEAIEGQVEHQIAGQLIHEVLQTEDENLWSARVKVLAELIEHHIEEEETDLLAEFRHLSTEADRLSLGHRFQLIKTQTYENETNLDHASH